MNSQKNLSLMRPRASITSTNKPGQSWYSLRAAQQRGLVEVMLYDEIGAWGITAKQFARDLAALGDVSQINLHIHSPGGDVFEGTTMYNLLRGHSARVVVYIDGLAASMASVIAMAGDEINMPANAMMMIHKPWGGQVGDADAMREYADLLDKVESTLIQAYTRKSGKAIEDIQALLKAETWMDGNEAVAAGFADNVLDPFKAAAQLTSKRMQEFTNMPTSAKNLFNPRGSAPTPAPAPAPAPTPAPLVDPAPVALTLDQMRAQVMAADGARRTAINAAFCGSLVTSHTELLNTCLNDLSCTAEMAREKLLVALGSTTTPTSGPGHHGHISNGNLVGDSVRASLAGRLGQAENQKDNAYNHMSLRELARASLHDRGILVATLDPMAMVGLAFTHDSSDFGNILVDSAAKSVLLGWDEAPETYHLWTKKGRLSDFKVASRVGMGAFPSLREVRPGAEYKYITTNDRGEKIRLATYGEMFSITRQAIINDDLDQLSTVPYNMGLAARGTIGDLVYDTLIHSPVMSDGKALFDAERNNLFSGTGANMSIEALSKAKTAMALQKTEVEGGKARTLNIRPAFVLVPVALEDKTNQLIRSASVPGVDTNAGIDNPIRNFATVIAEPRLDDDSPVTWYEAARQGADTIEVAYLDGVEQPYMEQQQGFTIDGVTSKVRIDAGVAALDYRGLNKSVGVVPPAKASR
ncbi:MULTISPECIES: ClpP-like prohead protease/major capsid protein fusion protein [unclassified Pseudomonas]|uniref:ClpP-like prohead protease/major capsid protein fusion protein n=1 Tax=unclassified Pseudomonas TaxID=196821 RepID=UPI001C438BC7|nr:MULTISPECIES: ClpP-like prohead protease/major capsid protein fusion protein [unclassified Pseudomonas]MBV7527128.1 Clp protease ClpP [Pseudomonas sp. PDM29]